MQTGEYKHRQTKRFPLALITVQLGEFMVGMHFNTLLCLSVEIVNITLITVNISVAPPFDPKTFDTRRFILKRS